MTSEKILTRDFFFVTSEILFFTFAFLLILQEGVAVVLADIESEKPVLTGKGTPVLSTECGWAAAD